MNARPDDTTADTIRVSRHDSILLVELDRPEVRNAVDSPTARALAEVFVDFDDDPSLDVAVFAGAHGTFCAGADLKAIGAGNFESFPSPQAPIDRHDGTAPMGPSYLRLDKPVVAAVSGYAVAGGLELSLWCDLRVVDEDAVFGVFCRRWGVPLIDGGTVRLPRLIGQSNALDMILTGRPVDAHEAKQMGLANRVVASGTATTEALALAEQLARFPRECMLNDRRSVHDQWNLSFDDAMANEALLGRRTLQSGETRSGAQRFAAGHGRAGRFDDI